MCVQSEVGGATVAAAILGRVREGGRGWGRGGLGKGGPTGQIKADNGKRTSLGDLPPQQPQGDGDAYMVVQNLQRMCANQTIECQLRDMKAPTRDLHD